MANPVALLTYPGIEDIESVSILHQPGVGPSQCTIVAPLERVDTSLLTIGTLRIIYENTEVLTWVDAAVESVSFEFASAHLVNITIVDRRWRWRWGAVFGKYNVRDEQTNELDPNYLQYTAQELATYIFDVGLGENPDNIDVSKLPSDVYPEVSWDDDTKASDEIAKLCDDYGCRVVLTHDNMVKVVEMGEGKQFPIDNSKLITPDINYPRRIIPGGISVSSAPIVFQERFYLYPVGEEIGDDLLPNQEKYRPAWSLSYLPNPTNQGNPNDWKTWPSAQSVGADPELGFIARLGVNELYNELVNKLAGKTLFKYFKIGRPVYSRSIVSDAYQCNFKDTVLARIGSNQFAKAYVLGHFDDEENIPDPNKGVAAYSTRRWEGNISIDNKAKLVILDSPCYFTRFPDPILLEPELFWPVLCLDVSYTYESTIINPFRFERSEPLPDALHDARYEAKIEESINCANWLLWSDDFNIFTDTDVQPIGSKDSYASTGAELDKVIANYKKRYRTQLGGQASYVGIYGKDYDDNDQPTGKWELDGLRDMLIYQFSSTQAPKTTLVINSKANPYMPLDEERRKNRALERMVSMLEGRQLQESLKYFRGLRSYGL